MMQTLNTQRVALPALAALALSLGLAGCGGGSSGSASEGSSLTRVDAFAYVQPIAASGGADTAEPQAVELLVLSSSETDEPDPRF